jgi:hypothetical protein
MPKKTLFAQQRDDLLQFKSCLIDAVQQKRRIIVLTFETERDGERFFDLNLQRIDSKLFVGSVYLDGRRTLESFKDLTYYVIEHMMRDNYTSEEIREIRRRDANSLLDEFTSIPMMLVCSDDPTCSAIDKISPALWEQFATPDRFKFVVLISRLFRVAYHCAARLGESAMLMQMTSEGFERIDVLLPHIRDASAVVPPVSAKQHAKWHTGVQIIRVQNAATLDELMADTVLGSLIVYRLSPTAAAVMPGRMTDVERRLKILGHHPQR